MQEGVKGQPQSGLNNDRAPLSRSENRIKKNTEYFYTTLETSTADLKEYNNYLKYRYGDWKKKS